MNEIQESPPGTASLFELYDVSIRTGRPAGEEHVAGKRIVAEEPPEHHIPAKPVYAPCIIRRHTPCGTAPRQSSFNLGPLRSLALVAGKQRPLRIADGLTERAEQCRPDVADRDVPAHVSGSVYAPPRRRRCRPPHVDVQRPRKVVRDQPDVCRLLGRRRCARIAPVDTRLDADVWVYPDIIQNLRRI